MALLIASYLNLILAAMLRNLALITRLIATKNIRGSAQSNNDIESIHEAIPRKLFPAMVLIPRGAPTILKKTKAIKSREQKVQMVFQIGRASCRERV